MVTYLYWGLVIVVAALLFTGGMRLGHWRGGTIFALCVLLVGMLAYYFHFEQVFVKRYGGVMSISVPQGQRHIAATWKDDNLWVENYDPKSNTCHFNEYSKGNLLQGKVMIKNCNPIAHDRIEAQALEQ